MSGCSTALEQRHEAEIHVVLHVAVEQAETWLVRGEIDRHLLKRTDHFAIPRHFVGAVGPKVLAAAHWRGRKARPGPVKARGSGSLAVRAPYSRANSCLRIRRETDRATVVPGSPARRNRRARPANARDETESRRRRDHGTIPPCHRRCRSLSRSASVAPEPRRSAGRFAGSSALPLAPSG